MENEGEAPPARRRGRARLLLAEDDPVIARMYRLKLEHDGFAVRVADDGVATVRQALEDPPDLLVLDLRLPALDGHGVMARLREHAATRLVPVVVLTALSEPRLVERSLHLGAHRHMLKDRTTPSMLSAHVTAILDDVHPGWRQRAWAER